MFEGAAPPSSAITVTHDCTSSLLTTLLFGVTLCVVHRFGLYLWDCFTLNKNVFSFHYEKMFGQTLFFLLTFSTDKENTGEGWASPSQHFCAIFHRPGWKDGRMIKSPFLFHFHVRRWYKTPIQVWEAKLDEWNMLPVWATRVTKQLMKLNKPNSRAQISTAAGHSSLR